MQQLELFKESVFQAKPFLKWAGGKGQLLEQLIQFLPQELESKKITKYIEPFIGGGAVFTHLVQSYDFEEVIICDINEELIIAYKTIQKDVENLINFLLELQNKYLFLDFDKREKYYYQIRESFNHQKEAINFQVYDERWVERTAQLIFLNRTCFNGLFRVNSQGHFNVPIGKYKNPLICNVKNLKVFAKLLQKTRIFQGDYTQCEKEINSQSLVYFDPPYRPISQTSNFKSYSKFDFDDEEQLRLRNFYDLLDRKGAKLMLSNSDPKNEKHDDSFFDEAYKKYNIKRVQVSRNINSNSQKRGKISEILVLNY